MLRYMTAGESHGECLVAILEGMPGGLRIDKASIDLQLKRRQSGYGRGRRMAIESDKVKIVSGLKKGYTTASPITFIINNKDKSIDKLNAVICPRPGHADLAGMLKYNTYDGRDILERASARETAARVSVGAACRQLLSVFDIDIFSHIKSLGCLKAHVDNLSIQQIKKMAKASVIGCADKNAEKLMKKTIDQVKKDKDTIGGVFEVIVSNVPVGLGSCMQYVNKLDARLAFELMSIQAIKAVSIGAGFNAACLKGSQVHDPISYKGKSFVRETNNAGGIEGGMSNGEPIRVTCAMKPISTLMQPLSSVNVKTKKSQKAAIERSDTCALTAASVVAENVAAIVIASAFLEKFGSDSLTEIKRNYQGYLKQLREF